ncbi:MAG: TIM barrel protein, partial [Proteobacteria bacterium]|nr:TIM barrel protein [Pseudomonadota bacterium]
KWIRNFSVRDAEKTVVAANVLGAKRVIVHPSDVINPNEFEIREQNLIDSLRELIETADKHGIKIYVENLRNGKMGNSLKWLLSFREKFKGKLDICFDTGHWLISERDSENFNGFGHYHIHDNNGKRDEHLFPGEGIFPWEKINFPGDAVVVYELMPEEKPNNIIKRIKEDKR